MIIQFKYLLVSLALVYSCKASLKTEQTKAPVPVDAIKATVTDYRDLDGCEFLLTLKSGSKLQPVALEEQFKKNGLEVWITYVPFDGVGICMAGQMVRLTFIQEVLGNNKQ
jgi:hypothetical protein